MAAPAGAAPAARRTGHADHAVLASGPGAGRAKKTGPSEQTRKRRNGSSKASASRERARRAIRAEDFALVRTLIRNGLKSRSRNERDAWRLLEAEMEFARRRYARAGLAAMRVVILHPRSAHHGAALYWAGRAYARLGRPAKAAELFEACVAHKTTRDSIRKKAEKRLKGLKKRPAHP